MSSASATFKSLTSSATHTMPVVVPAALRSTAKLTRHQTSRRDAVT
ncbi:MAG: hypothetical protein MUE69_19380 [Myxococcota bacterium]|nr:hypothetical protein [Myxococcota bacterium]